MKSTPEAIGLEQALKLIRSCTKSSQKRCSIEFVSFDRRRKGSTPKIILGAFIAAGNPNHDEMKNGTIHVATDTKFQPTPIHVCMIMKVNNSDVHV